MTGTGDSMDAVGFDSTTGFLDRGGCLRTAVRLADASRKERQPLGALWLDLQCKADVLSGETPIRASRNAAGKLVLDGFPGGDIETFVKKH